MENTENSCASYSQNRFASLSEGKRSSPRQTSFNGGDSKTTWHQEARRVYNNNNNNHRSPASTSNYSSGGAYHKPYASRGRPQFAAGAARAADRSTGTWNPRFNPNNGRTPTYTNKTSPYMNNDLAIASTPSLSHSRPSLSQSTARDADAEALRKKKAQATVEETHASQSFPARSQYVASDASWNSIPLSVVRDLRFPADSNLVLFDVETPPGGTYVRLAIDRQVSLACLVCPVKAGAFNDTCVGRSHGGHGRKILCRQCDDGREGRLGVLHCLHFVVRKNERPKIRLVVLRYRMSCSPSSTTPTLCLVLLNKNARAHPPPVRSTHGWHPSSFAPPAAFRSPPFEARIGIFLRSTGI